MDENERKQIVESGVRSVLAYKPSWRIVRRQKPKPWRLFRELLAILLSGAMLQVAICYDGSGRWVVAGLLFACLGPIVVSLWRSP
jgi:uncharacterized membrane protein YhhN